jgi:hypothetical protein
MKTLLLYSDDFGKTNGTASRYVDASIDGDTLTVNQQDIGPMFGDKGDMERTSTVSLLAVKKALSVDSDENLLLVLKQRFNTMGAFDEFSDFIRKNNIKVLSYWNG